MVVSKHAVDRKSIDLDQIRAWHRDMMKGLAIPEAAPLGVRQADLKGHFRGPPKLPGIAIRVGAYWGVPADEVAAACDDVMQTLQTLIAGLDQQFSADQLDAMSAQDVSAICTAAAWTHAEWVRIHPFGNGNGRMSRLLGNWVLMRYGLRPVLRMRPRPDGSYEDAAQQNMFGGHAKLADFIEQSLIASARW